MNVKERNRFSPGEDEEDDDFVIPQEIDGKPIRELTRELIDPLDGIEIATTVVVPDSATTVKNNAFEDCGSVTSAMIPGSVTSVYRGGFVGCERLTRAEIPNSSNSETSFFQIHAALLESSVDGKTYAHRSRRKLDENAEFHTARANGVP